MYELDSQQLLDRPVRRDPDTWFVTATRYESSWRLQVQGEPTFPSHGVEQAANDDVTVALAGEFHGQATIAARLGLPRNASRAQLALAAYVRWGRACHLHLDGVFALVVVDHARGSLVATRDRAGIHPLFVARTTTGAVLGITAETVACHPDVNATPDPVRIAESLCSRWYEPTETLWAEVCRVPPAQTLEIRGHSWDWQRTWDPMPDRSKPEWATRHEVDGFSEELTGAVARFTNGRTAALFLSGGLDSVSVAAALKDHCEQVGLSTPLALSMVFPYPECNEEHVQARVAQTLGLPQRFLNMDEAVGSGGLVHSMLRAAREWPHPLLNIWSPAYEALGSLAASAGVEVLMTGNGGDEWLGVSPYWAADLLPRLHLRNTWLLWRSGLRSHRLSRAAWTRNVLWRFGLRPALGRGFRRVFPRMGHARRARRMVRALPAWLQCTSDIRAAMEDRARAKVPPRVEGSFYLHYVAQGLDHPIVCSEREDDFERGRRLGMALAHPFLDARLLSLLVRIHPRDLLRQGMSKGLVRESLERRFPELGFAGQRKIHVRDYLQDKMRSESRAAMDELGGFPRLNKLGIVQQKGIIDNTHAFCDGNGALQNQEVRAHLILESWLQGQSQRKQRGTHAPVH